MIYLSPAAIHEINRLQRKHHQAKAALRLGVQPSSCAEMAYKMEFTHERQPEDQAYEADGVMVIVDPRSLQFLEGLRLDYSEDLMGGGFRFHNPNAEQSCGCGNAFALKK